MEQENQDRGKTVTRSAVLIRDGHCVGPVGAVELGMRIVYGSQLGIVTAQHPLFLPTATRTSTLFRQLPITHMALRMVISLLVQESESL